MREKNKIKRTDHKVVEDTIKIYIKETGCEDVDWIQIVQDKDPWRTVGNTGIHFSNQPSNYQLPKKDPAP